MLAGARSNWEQCFLQENKRIEGRREKVTYIFRERGTVQRAKKSQGGKRFRRDITRRTGKIPTEDTPGQRATIWKRLGEKISDRRVQFFLKNYHWDFKKRAKPARRTEEKKGYHTGEFLLVTKGKMK